MQGRRGFTLVEAMMVVAIMGGLVLFSLPRFAALQERSRLNSARQQVEAAIATARAAAIQTGRTSTLSLTGNSMLVTVTDASGLGQVTIIPSMPFDTVYGVTVTATNPTITFDMRGFASPKLTGSPQFTLIGTTRRDSVCITIVGQIKGRGCTL
jgi:prepilin-type N-terminal cleavage/methylation domain-containing protein